MSIPTTTVAPRPVSPSTPDQPIRVLRCPDAPKKPKLNNGANRINN